MKRLEVREGLPLEVDAQTAMAIRRRLLALQVELRPRIGFLSGTDAFPAVQNLVGSVQITSDLVLDVSPKTEPDQYWAAAIVDLLLDDRVEFGGEAQDAEMMSRLALADVLGQMYAMQLDRAIRREGPLAVLVRRHSSKQRLAGRLDITRWVSQSLLRPTTFPQVETLLTVDNDFTAAMAWVAEALAARSRDPGLASRLRNTAGRLRPGLPAHVQIDPGVAARQVPTQWRSYGPAWTTACAVLRRLSPLHRSGFLEGFGLAIEPWPLLERLLLRSLHATARQAAGEGYPLRAQGHSAHRLLAAQPLGAVARPLARLARDRGVEPDGSLWLGKQVVATFEAKYSRVDTDRTFRGHVFQAMTTAAALSSPLAVLVYPESSDPVSWQVHGFDGKPLQLVAVGLDMFGYRIGAGDELRGARLLEIIKPTVKAQSASHQICLPAV